MGGRVFKICSAPHCCEAVSAAVAIGQAPISECMLHNPVRLCRHIVRGAARDLLCCPTRYALLIFHRYLTPFDLDGWQVYRQIMLW